DTRPPPSSLSNAPKKIIGNAAAVMPSRNSPTPPIIEIVVDIYPLTNQTGVHCSAASTRSQERKGIPLAGFHLRTIPLTTLHHRGPTARAQCSSHARDRRERRGSDRIAALIYTSALGTKRINRAKLAMSASAVKQTSSGRDQRSGHHLGCR